MHDVSLARGLVSSRGSLIPGLGQSVRYDGTDQLRVSGVSLASSLPAASALSPTSFLFPGADSGFASLPSSFPASSSSSSRNLSVPSVSLSYSFASSSSSSSSAPAPSVLSASSSGVPPLSFPPLSSVLPPRSGGSLPPPPPPGFPPMPLASFLSSSSFSAPGLASSFASYLSLAHWFVGGVGGGPIFSPFFLPTFLISLLTLLVISLLVLRCFCLPSALCPPLLLLLLLACLLPRFLLLLLGLRLLFLCLVSL